MKKAESIVYRVSTVNFHRAEIGIQLDDGGELKGKQTKSADGGLYILGPPTSLPSWDAQTVSTRLEPIMDPAQAYDEAV